MSCVACYARELMTSIAELFSWAELPWSEVSETQIIPKILNREKLLIPNSRCPDAMYEAMLACWRLGLFMRVVVVGIHNVRTDPQARPSGEELHALIQDMHDSDPRASHIVWPSDLSEHVALGQHALNPEDVEMNDMMERMEVPASAVTTVSTLGEGEFGLVQLGLLKASHMRNTSWTTPPSGNKDVIRVAVKTTKADLGPEQQRQFVAEGKLLCAFSHPGIVRALAVCFKQQPAFIVTELMPGGDLLHYLIEHSEQLRDDAVVRAVDVIVL